MITKNLDEYFNPQINKLEKLKKQKELLEKFSGEILIYPSRGGCEFVSKNYALADKIQISKEFGDYDTLGAFWKIEESKDNQICYFDFQFELKDEESEMMLPISCRHEHSFEADYMNVIYQIFHSTSKADHYTDWDIFRTVYSRPVDAIIEFYQNQGVKKDLLLDLYTQINEIRTQHPEEIKRF